MGANFRTRVQKFSSFVSLTSDEHYFFVRTPFEVFLDSMESPLSQESRFIPVEDNWNRGEVVVFLLSCPSFAVIIFLTLILVLLLLQQD